MPLGKGLESLIPQKGGSASGQSSQSSSGPARPLHGPQSSAAVQPQHQGKPAASQEPESAHPSGAHREPEPPSGMATTVNADSFEEELLPAPAEERMLEGRKEEALLPAPADLPELSRPQEEKLLRAEAADPVIPVEPGSPGAPSDTAPRSAQGSRSAQSSGTQYSGAQPLPAKNFGGAQPFDKAQGKQGKPQREPFDYAHGKESIFYLETAKIKPNEHQPRRYFDEDAIRDLANSIREFGVLQPIVVTKKEKEVPGGTEVEYELLAGERRLLASKSLGMERIPAVIRHVDLERERLEIAIIENLQREDLNGIEMARAFAQLQDEFRLTQREIAQRLGKSRETVANTMRLLDLPGSIQEAIAKGEVSESHGLLLLGVQDPAEQQALFRDLVQKKLTIRELRDRAKAMRRTRSAGTPAGRAEAAADAEFKSFEEHLAADLGAPVKIERKGGGGKILISFYSDEEFQNILRRLGGGEE